MCGIAGAVWIEPAEPVSKAVLQRMTDVLSHRGPDASGSYYVTSPAIGVAAEFNASAETAEQVAPVARRPGGNVGVAFGHRRLSIIDLEGGSQPLANEDETVWIVFNGEIYNYRELRPQLESAGHRFRTSSDTETIVHLYEQYGPDCVQHLRGMFAFAVWDARRQRLFLARDRMGQKPLVYRHEAGRLLFASELKSLLQVPGLSKQLNPRALDHFLTYQYVPHPECILRGFSKLPPAHTAIYEKGRLEIKRYWSPPYSLSSENSASLPEHLRDCGNWSAADWQRQLRETLTEAVRLRMRSDVPLGAFLSGGIDSTIITGLMQQLSEQPVHSFSIGFPVKQFDETSYARDAVRHLGTNHHETVVEPEALAILPKLIWHYDEPFSDSSAIPCMYLSEMTRRHVTVALSGDGSDELFAGYDRYRAVRIAGRIDRLPGPIKSMMAWPVWQRLPASVRQKSYRRRVKRLLAELANPPERRYLRWITSFDELRRAELYSDGFRAELDGVDSADFLLDAYSECGNRDFVTRTTCVDALTYLPCDILTKVDIASMAYSLECRSPFLDHHVAELAARMPIELKQTARQGKQILLDTFGDLLPPSIRRRSKMGFGVPLDHWFRDELKPLLYDTLLDSRSLERGYFDPAAVRRLVDEHINCAWDHSYRLWSLLCFEMWQQMFLDRDVPSMAPSSI